MHDPIGDVSQQKKRILILDDETTVQNSLRIVLNYQGYNVETASTGAEGFRLLEIDRFDLLILDIKIPDVDGFEILERVHESHPNLKVFIITGFGTLDIARKALAYGALHYFDKPIDLERFINSVNKTLKN
ncbi:response regulator [bacterium]|nr:response regulator [candidate division CSSED10-310 bacterium]